MRMIIKYEDYKRFGGEATITFGETIEGGAAEEESGQQPVSVRPGTEPVP